MAEEDCDEPPYGGPAKVVRSYVASPPMTSGQEDKSFRREVERGLTDEEDQVNRRRVMFRDGDALVSEFDDSNLWAHDPNETALDMIESYKQECLAVKVRPIGKVLEQLERLDDLSIPIDTLDLKGVKLDSRSCEVLEAVLSRMQMTTLDVEHTSLEDEGVIALCEMVEFYGCASRINISHNKGLRPRAWLTVGRMLKKSPFIDMVNVSYCGLDDQTLTLLLRSVRANCALQVLKSEGNSLAGKGTFILMAAMKFNENLRELYLANNQLGPEDGQHLGAILRTNHTLHVVDVRDNKLQDAGVRYICAGIAEQQEGLSVLNVSSNGISQDGVHHISAMLPCTKSLRELNLSRNLCGDNGMYLLKLGLLANRSVEKLVLADVKITCEGAIALAEILAENKYITHLDVKDNDVRVAGLMALQLAHRMNHTLLFLETPKSFRVEQRDRQLVRDMLVEIDRYCSRNVQEKEERAVQERRRQHEAQHVQQCEIAVAGGGQEETGHFTAGSSDAQEVDSCLAGSLDNVYSDEPEAEDKDPFSGTIMDDNEKPTSLTMMEKSLDAMTLEKLSCRPSEAEASAQQDTSVVDRVSSPNEGAEHERIELDILQQHAATTSNVQSEELPDLVGSPSVEGKPEQRQGVADLQPEAKESPPPDVASQTSMPLDLAAEVHQAVDLLDKASVSLDGPSHLVN